MIALLEKLVRWLAIMFVGLPVFVLLVILMGAPDYP